jgi:hypothetical protein
MIDAMSGLNHRWARAWLGTVVAIALAAGCSAAPHPAPQPATADPPVASSTATAVDPPVASAPPAASAATTETTPDSFAAIETRVGELMAMAAAVEPAVTPLLQRHAAEVGGELIKLKYRLKTKGSAMRKVRARMADDPKLAPHEVVLDDCLRYTLQVGDEPAGHHVEVILRVLAALKTEGHEVVRLKNYWPDDDNYSGVNSILRANNGLLWELQFHTPQSIAAAATTRNWYEELRCVDTKLERKRELFDKMTSEWNRVPIPTGILEPGALGAHDDIIERPRP